MKSTARHRLTRFHQQEGECLWCGQLTWLNLETSREHAKALLGPPPEGVRIKDFLRARRATIEHIVPKSMGGRGTFDNLAMACNECNSTRSSNLRKHTPNQRVLTRLLRGKGSQELAQHIIETQQRAKVLTALDLPEDVLLDTTWLRMRDWPSEWLPLLSRPAWEIFSGRRKRVRTADLGDGLRLINLRLDPDIRTFPFIDRIEVGRVEDHPFLDLVPGDAPKSVRTLYQAERRLQLSQCATPNEVLKAHEKAVEAWWHYKHRRFS